MQFLFLEWQMTIKIIFIFKVSLLFLIYILFFYLFCWVDFAGSISMDASTTDIIGIVGFNYIKSVKVAENVSIPPNEDAIAKENALMLKSVLVLDLMAMTSHMCTMMVAGEVCTVGLRMLELYFLLSLY